MLGVTEGCSVKEVTSTVALFNGFIFTKAIWASHAPFGTKQIWDLLGKSTC